MTDDHPTVLIPATPDYVLAVFRDWYRQARQFGEAEPDVDLTFETTIDEWRDANDLYDDWRDLGEALDDEWGLALPDAAWKAVLEPARVRTLGGLCEFIAARAIRPTIAPVTVLGKTCLPAGAFLTIRSLLREAGAEVGSVGPSTPLDHYTRHYPQVFIGPVSRLAPGALPAVEVSMPWLDRGVIGLILGLLTSVGGWLTGSTPVMVAGTVLTGVSLLGNMLVAQYMPPAKFDFGQLRTFRDMARALADEAR